MSRVRILVLAAAVAVALVAVASDAPHTKFCPVGAANVKCDACHTLHNSSSTALLGAPGNQYSANSSFCMTCHSNATPIGKGHGFTTAPPWGPLDQAASGTGTSHRWDTVIAGNHGASAPQSDLLIDTGGKLMCSTCHDPHVSTTNGGSQFVSFPIGVAQAPNSFGSGGSALTITQVDAGALAKGYWIEATTASAFKISHDNGATWATGYPVSGALDDSKVHVTFSGATVGNRWAFYVGYPFLRKANSEGELCLRCHKNRNMTHANVEGSGTLPNGAYGTASYGLGTAVAPGTTVFSHPVGQTLNANGNGLDRAANAILDADGATTQLTGGDGNATNNLKLSPTGNVTCMTCHNPHHADSNSLTVDTGK